jgi:hypothetical protein
MLIMETIDFRLDHWMEDLMDKIMNLPLSRLIMPGTHDSGTYGIPIPSWDPLDIGLKTYNASRTQSKSISDQLLFGARYVDLRIRRFDGEKGYKLHHGPVKTTISLDNALNQINNFIDNHTKEIVILGITPYDKHFQSDVNKIFNIIKTKFNNKIASPIDFPGERCIQDFWDKGKQIILFWNNNKFPSNDHDLFWKIKDKNKDEDIDHFESAYGGIDSTPKDFTIELKKRIETWAKERKEKEDQKDRNAYRPFVIQGVVPAPPEWWKYIGIDDYPINIHKMIKDVHPQFIKLIEDMWTSDQQKSLLSIITVDFFDECPDNFFKKLIQYNIQKQDVKSEQKEEIFA